VSEGATSAPARLGAFAADLYHCADCGYCVDAVWVERGIDHVCPTIGHHAPIASYSGRGFIAAARAWVEGAALDRDVLAERVFACTGCGNCEQVCPIGLRPAQVGAALREELVATGHAPASVDKLRAAMRTHGNPHARPAAERGAWAGELSFAAQDATVLYAPGCACAYTAPGEAGAVVALMARAGERVAFRGDADRCCGAPLGEAGFVDDAAYAEQRLAHDVSAVCVVTSGLECWPAWHRALGADTPVFSFSAWLLAALESGRLRIAAPPSLRVHAFDACASRRRGAQSGTPDPLREVLARMGAVVVNDARFAAAAVCCGAAGTMAGLAPDSAQRMAQARLVDVAHADVLVASDTRCGTHLAAAADAGTAPVVGLAAFVQQFCTIGGDG